MNVLSLFDGMSCGQQALERAGIPVEKYFASEVDKYAIQVTMANYPNTIQLGSVVNVSGAKLPQIDILIGGSPCQSFSFAGKRKGMATKCETDVLTLEHYLELKAQGFEFEGQSYLFWEYVRIFKEVRPQYFLLENVIMGEKWEKVISKALGVNPIEINSSTVSAQNRRRLYWTNIGMAPCGFFGDLESIIEQPKDRGIVLKDILEDNPNSKYTLSAKMLDYFGKRAANFNKGKVNVRDENNKASTITASSKSLDISDNFIEVSSVCNSEKPQPPKQIITHIFPEMVKVRKFPVDVPALQKCLREHKKETIAVISESLEVQKSMVEHWFRNDSFFSIPDAEIWPRLKEFLNIETNEFDESIMEFDEKEGVFEKTNRVYDENGLAPTLTSTASDERILIRHKNIEIPEKYFLSEKMVTGLNKHNDNSREKKRGFNFEPTKGEEKGKCLRANAFKQAPDDNYILTTRPIASSIRRLTPLECERLQTVADGYTAHVSDTQRYKMLGNGWTVEVIAHILNYINK